MLAPDSLKGPALLVLFLLYQCMRFSVGAFDLSIPCIGCSADGPLAPASIRPAASQAAEDHRTLWTGCLSAVVRESAFVVVLCSLLARTHVHVIVLRLVAAARAADATLRAARRPRALWPAWRQRRNQYAVRVPLVKMAVPTVAAATAAQMYAHVRLTPTLVEYPTGWTVGDRRSTTPACGCCNPS